MPDPEHDKLYRGFFCLSHDVTMTKFFRKIVLLNLRGKPDGCPRPGGPCLAC